MPRQELFDKHGAYFGSVNITDDKNPDARVIQINLMPCLGVNNADSLWHTILHHLHEMNQNIDAAHNKKKKVSSLETTQG